MRTRRLALTALCAFMPVFASSAQATSDDIWPARAASLTRSDTLSRVRVAIWDSGVDTTLFRDRLARDAHGRAYIRAYDQYLRRRDTPLAALDGATLARQNELNGVLITMEDVYDSLDTPAARALSARLKAMSQADKDAFYDVLGTWNGYSHGTGVAGVTIAGHPTAEIVVARMQWPDGNPPVPCWTADLIREQARVFASFFEFFRETNVRVVNLSWGRYESSYLSDLAACAAQMPVDARRAVARFAVDTLRLVLQRGMASMPQTLFVGASGNAASTVQAENPATRFSLPNFILVGAVTRAGTAAWFTNTGPEVGIYAPGVRVPAPLVGSGALAPSSGTSFATPIVSNTAALMLAVNPELTGGELRALLIATSDSNATGLRLLHPRRAVEAARNARRPR